MPSIPNWLANTMEKVSPKYYHAVTVSKTKYITPKLKEIRFDGDFSEYPFVSGNVIEFRISDTEFRHYTVSKFSKSYCETLIYIHDLGPGSKWAADLKIGQELKLIGPGRKMNYNDEFAHHVVFGDETSVGLALNMIENAKIRNQQITALIEVDEQNLNWQEQINNTEIVWLRTSIDSGGTEAVERLNGYPNLDTSVFYLTGRAKSIQNVGKFLKSKSISKNLIQTYPYWAEGKKGL